MLNLGHTNTPVRCAKKKADFILNVEFIRETPVEKARTLEED